jgi:outer membrane protein OmpA-like peptidoglycan-associated protein
VVSGQPPPELREIFERELEAIHKDFAFPLQNFSGDTATLAGAEVNLRRCLLGGQKPSAKRSYRTVWIVFALLLLAIAGLAAIRVRDNRRWSRYVERLQGEPGIVVVEQKRYWFGYEVNGLRDPLAIDPRPLLRDFQVPEQKVSERWEPYLSLDPKFDASRLMATEITHLEREVIRFDLNSSQLPINQFDVLETAVDDIKTLERTATANKQRIEIQIAGHTDNTGKEDRNVELSQQRAMTVAMALEQRGVAAYLLSASGLADSNPEYRDLETYPHELDRRVTFRVMVVGATK